jgi:hypothetical protein
VALLVAVVVWSLRLPQLMHIGTGHAALHICACLFVSKRPLASCETDLEPLARRILSIRPGDSQVTSHVIGVFNATARYEPGFGCSLRD